jgi:hypothetical protein
VQDVGVDVEETANAPDIVPVDDPGFDFAVAGTEVAGEFRCVDCSYGAVVQRALPPCPMCGGTIWERLGPRFVD